MKVADPVNKCSPFSILISVSVIHAYVQSLKSHEEDTKFNSRNQKKVFFLSSYGLSHAESLNFSYLNFVICNLSLVSESFELIKILWYNQKCPLSSQRV